MKIDCESHNPRQRQFYRNNPLYEKVYNYIMKRYKSERDVFTLEDIVSEFNNLLWDVNEYYYTDEVSAKRNSILCIEEVLEHLSKTGKIKIYDTGESDITYYVPICNIQDKELREADSRWAEIKKSSYEEPVPRALLTMEILKLKDAILQMLKNSGRIEFDLETVKEVLAMNNQSYNKEDIDYICEQAIRLLLDNGSIKITEYNNLKGIKYVVVKKAKEQHRDEDHGEH